MKIKYILPAFFLLFFCCATNNNTASAGTVSMPIEPVLHNSESADKVTEETLPEVNLLTKFKTELTDTENYTEAVDIYSSYLQFIKETPPKNDSQQKEAESILALFADFISNIQIKKNPAPPETIKNGAFKIPFSVTLTAKNTQKSLAGIPLIVSYPVSSKNGVCEFLQTTIYTDTSGTAEFNAEKPTFTCNSAVTFTLKAPSAQGEIEAIKAEIPYRIYTDLRNRGTSIAVVDLDKNGKPTPSSQTSSLLLTALIRQSGFSNIGNSDFTAQVLSDNAQSVQREAMKLFSNSVTCLIYGTTSYKTVRSDSKTEVTMTATIFARNIPKNIELFTSNITVTAINAREATAVTDARQQLANILSEQLKYGL